jgi:5-methylcytosine-specific restriction endonuclease McrA
MMLRACKKCGGVFPLNKDNFGHQPNGNFRYTCRACVRRKVRAEYYDNPWRSLERTELRRTTVLSSSERVKIKRQLMSRDGDFVCFYCKKPLDSSYHIDHKCPIGRGGTHELANFALACLQCNQEKHNKDLDQYRAWLRRNGDPVLF